MLDETKTDSGDDWGAALAARRASFVKAMLPKALFDIVIGARDRRVIIAMK